MPVLENACRVLALALVGCSTGQVAAPRPTHKREPEVEPPETEADRIAQRRSASTALIAPDTNCLPDMLRRERPLRLELATVGDAARLCAIDVDRKRLLGPVACWTLDFTAGSVTYLEPAPLPGRGFAVKLDGACARGFCLPDDPDTSTVEIAWSLDGRKVAVLADTRVHLFDTASQHHEASFKLGPGTGKATAIHHLGSHLLVETEQDDAAPVWVYEIDGTIVGPITSAAPGPERPLSARHGAVALLDATRVAIGERGIEELTIYDLASGARSKLTRKLAQRPACKPDEVAAFWRDPEGDEVSDGCRDRMTQLSGHLIGATVIGGRTSLLALLRNERAGQLAVLDPKTLAEKRAISLPWCPKPAPDDDTDTDDNDDDDDDDDEPRKPKGKDDNSGWKGKPGARSKGVVKPKETNDDDGDDDDDE